MILVTGGTGLLGSHLIYRLVSEGKKVRATHRKGSDLGLLLKVFEYYSDKPNELSALVEWVEADLEDVTAVQEAMQGVKQVYHCAAIVSFEAKKAQLMLEKNPLTTANVVNAALVLGVEKLVYSSSVAALGRKSESEHIDEETQWDANGQNSNYAISKHKAELEVWRGIEEGVDAVIVNPTIILGPGNWEQGSSALFHTIAKGFKYYTQGANGFVDVRDVAEIMVRLMGSSISAERYVTVSESLDYKTVFSWIAEGLGIKPPQKEVKLWMSAIAWRLEKLRTSLFGGTPVLTKETAATSQRKYYYDNAKIRRELGFEFTSVKQTTEDFAKLYLKDH